MLNLRYSDAGLNLTKRYEGLRLRAYQDQGGIWTVGYGHTGPGAVPGAEVTPLEAEVLLRADLRTALNCINSAVQAPVQQCQFDALVDFCFNTGSTNFLHSTLLRKVNARDYPGAAEQFCLWIHVNGEVNRGLQRRRVAEKAMFCGAYRANSIA